MGEYRRLGLPGFDVDLSRVESEATGRGRGRGRGRLAPTRGRGHGRPGGRAVDSARA